MPGRRCGRRTRATVSSGGLSVVMDPRKDSRREELTRSAGQELTATLWCLAVLLAVVLLAYWGMHGVYSS